MFVLDYSRYWSKGRADTLYRSIRAGCAGAATHQHGNSQGKTSSGHISESITFTHIRMHLCALKYKKNKHDQHNQYRVIWSFYMNQARLLSITLHWVQLPALRRHCPLDTMTMTYSRLSWSFVPAQVVVVDTA